MHNTPRFFGHDLIAHQTKTKFIVVTNVQQKQQIEPN